jgi:exosortase C (VPDSG-CTERM-specific)
LLLCAFAKPLTQLIGFALHSTLFSHILLIPFVSVYLVRIKRASLPSPSAPRPVLAVAPLVLGVLALFGGSLASSLGLPSASADRLTWTTLSLVFLFWSACCFCLGPQTLRFVAFPLGFLLFAVPLPRFAIDLAETFLQYASALTADLFFTVTGMSFLRDGLIFQLPSIRLEVAPECSGIHSTLVLLITSFFAGQIFLRTFTNRALLVLAVIPLGILRNAFRIWTLGELCTHIGPHMIESPIHHRGGPIFFAISLVPLFLLLYFQRRWELKTRAQKN